MKKKHDLLQFHVCSLRKLVLKVKRKISKSVKSLKTKKSEKIKKELKMQDLSNELASNI